MVNKQQKELVESCAEKCMPMIIAHDLSKDGPCPLSDCSYNDAFSTEHHEALKLGKLVVVDFVEGNMAGITFAYSDDVGTFTQWQELAEFRKGKRKVSPFAGIDIPGKQGWSIDLRHLSLVNNFHYWLKQI